MPGPVRRPTLTAVLSDFPPSLRKLLLADSLREDATAAALWDRYLASRSAADERALIEFYTPAVAVWVQKTVKNRPSGFPDPLEDYISDGMLGLIQFIRRNRFFKPGLTYCQVRRAIGKAVWDEARNRSWAGKSRTCRARTIELIRASLVSETGQLPSREQIIERLRVQVTNPNYYFSSIDEELIYTDPRSQLERDEDRNVMNSVDPVSSPLQNVLDAERVDLCLKGLKGVDRKIFRMLLKGVQPTLIGKKLGLTKSVFLRRLNGLLWEARCRADLAFYLDEVPVAVPDLKKGNYPAFKITERLKRVG